MASLVDGSEWFHWWVVVSGLTSGWFHWWVLVSDLISGW